MTAIDKSWAEFMAAKERNDAAYAAPAHSPRACFYCGKVLMAARGFIETVSQPDGERRDFCSRECLHWQLHEDEKL